MEPEREVMTLADQKAMQFMRLDPTAKEFNRDTFDTLERQANFGHKVKREANVHQRTQQDQILRAIRMIGESAETREAYIRASQPRLLPQLKGKP